MDETKRLIRKIYLELDSPAAFAGVDRVLEEARKYDKTISREFVEKVLQGEPTFTLHKPRRITRFPRLRTLATGINSDWQADLADFRNIKDHNDGFNYLLVCVDVFSRKMYGEPLKTKEIDNVMKGFKKIFKRAKAIPVRLTTDQGKEFGYNPKETPNLPTDEKNEKGMKKFFREYNIIKREIKAPGIHAGIVERANRTIKSRLYKYFTQYKTNRWINVVQKIIASINSSKNRTLGMSPNEVTQENSAEIYNRLFRPMESLDKPRYKVGDIVRIDKYKTPFEKSYLPNFTSELFRISHVKTTEPVHYKIVDLRGVNILGVFYPEELSKTRLKPNVRLSEIIGERVRRGKTEYKVKWIGEDKIEWVKADNERYKLW